MASATKMFTKDGRPFYKLQHSRGRGVSPLTRRWYVPDGWSQKSIDRELQKQLRQFESDIQAGLVLSRSERKQAEAEAEAEKLKHPSFQQYVENTFLPRRSSYADNTLRNYRDNCRIHLNPVFGACPIDQITPLQVSQFVADLTASGLKYSTVTSVFKCLRAIMRDAYKTGAITVNPCDRADGPRRPKDQQEVKATEQALTPEETARLLDCMEDEPLHWQVFVHLAVDTGCRRGELCALQWQDVDWKASVVSISRNVQPVSGKGLVVTTPKNASSVRTVDVGTDTLDLLRQLRQEQAGRAISPWVFAGQDPGKPMSPFTVSGFFHRVRERYGFPELHCHTLRHSAATVAITSGADVASVSRRLGHSDISTTLNIYTAPDQSAIRKAGSTARQAIRQARQKQDPDSRRAP